MTSHQFCHKQNVGIRYQPKLSTEGSQERGCSLEQNLSLWKYTCPHLSLSKPKYWFELIETLINNCNSQLIISY